MPFQRFDNSRLTAVPASDVSPRGCHESLALVQACRLGSGPATRPLPWQPARIEWTFGVLHVRDLAVARRACLLLDGCWGMEDAASTAERLRIRLAAQVADWAWWRPLQVADAWDAGLARSVTSLSGFHPRRATLIVVDHAVLDPSTPLVLAELEQQARSWRRAVRLVIAGGPPPAFARPVGA